MSKEPPDPALPLDIEWQGHEDLRVRLDPTRIVSGSKEDVRCLLVGVYQGSGQKAVAEEHLAELERLCDTYGLATGAKIACPLRSIDAATFLGKGKIEELSEIAKEQRFDAIVFDEEILPGQQRNLEKLFRLPVLDRTEIILGVFAQRARTREARLQVELAQAKYQFPRLRRLWSHLGRQSGSGGGGTYVKGEGETQLEIDRRILRARIDKLTKLLEQVRQQRKVQRQARQRGKIPTFAIVGYTNAGKSTLLNALTQAGVFVEDKLFATLDTTTRKFTLPNHQEILLIDTVGFIRKLPHSLVQAFRSTLEEACYADILIHLVDSSQPHALEEAKVTLEVLEQLKAQDRPILTVLNKTDAVVDRTIVDRLRLTFPKTIRISALTHEGFDDLLRAMEEELKHLRQTLVLRIPMTEYPKVAEIRQQGHVLLEEYEEDQVVVRCELPKEILYRFESYIEEAPAVPEPEVSKEDSSLPEWMR